MICVGILLVWCSAAATQPAERVPSLVCPTQRVYSLDMQRRAAAELRALPKDSALAVMVADYGTVRAKCRAIEGRADNGTRGN